MLESKVQRKLIKKLESEGWYVVKIIACNKNGFPDLICFKNGTVECVEVKAKKGVVSELQKYRIKELNEKGIKAYVYYDN